MPVFTVNEEKVADSDEDLAVNEEEVDDSDKDPAYDASKDVIEDSGKSYFSVHAFSCR